MLRFDWREMNLGTILTLAPVETTFTFTNGGANPVRILSVRSSCGCTAVAPSDTLIEPGESGVISATFNPAGRAGSQHKVITVRTDDPAAPEVRLSFICSVTPAVLTEPEALILKGIGEGEGAELSFSLRPAEGLRIRNVRLESSTLQLVREPRSAVSPPEAGKATRLADDNAWKAVLPAGAGEGTVTGTLVVEFADSDLPPHTQPISIQMVGPYTASPSLVVGRKSDDEDSLSLDLALARRDEKSFTVLRYAMSETGEISADLEWSATDSAARVKASAHSIILTPDLTGLAPTTRLWTGWVILEAEADDGHHQVKIPARVFFQSNRPLSR